MKFSIIVAVLLISVSFSAMAESGSGVKINSTVLKDQTVFVIKSQKEAVIRNEYVAIIRNKYAGRAKEIAIFYDDFTEIKNAEVSIHSLDGKQIEKIKLKDFEDYGVGLSNTASDSRLKYFEPKLSSYPYILKVSYELHKSGSLHYPIWRPQQEENMEVKSASFTVEDYSGNGIQYKMYQLAEPKISKDGKANIYKWTVENLSTFEFEYYNYSLEDYTPILYTAPKNFEMDGVKGDMSSWESFGKWMAKLNEGRDDISNLDLSDLDGRIKNANTDMDKIRLVYDYLQNNTRYVSIQLGIGGWQPFEASFVHEKKYGDCKALSNYTQALLERYEVYSFYTLIRAGKYQNEVKEDFPNAHFNHAIVTVPMEKDTIFLECTSQTNPFGYTGTFTSNRNALMITPEGGKLISTKKYSPDVNAQFTYVKVDMTDAEETSIAFERNYKGMQIENHDFDRLYWKDSNEFKKWLRKHHEWGGQKIGNSNLLALTDNPIPEAGYRVEFTSNSEFVNMGDRKFISPGRYLDSYLPNLPNKDRETAIKVTYGYTQYDTIRYQMDQFHILEKDLTRLELNSEYGEYFRELKKEGQEIIFVRKFKMVDGEYPVEKYEEFKDFIQKVRSADQEKFVLLNKT
ncbi:DUF3857 domain-containing protein [Marivirga harenae]|mgnify:CR=1 FL=1|uniref:DUF3857 domain-containing protein n=1 Tax=Marivirga harenae TaxID=2010992 RepID=UPI0026E0E213|nr:DUF3857 domain-containing protein [Marivirga harenae]WKV11299.1 DUF3857 domain-containing protein [Marivirga harenae]|tara:strand:+ start:34647 stop:36527 length:1881 start_codon:yes stop_codon:yes gene_type:complete